MPAVNKLPAKNPVDYIKNILSSDNPPAQLLIISPDRVRRERVTHSILKKFCQGYGNKNTSLSNITRINAENLNAAAFQEFADNTNTLSLFSSHKFFIINNLENFPSSLNQDLLKLLNNASEGLSLIFHAKKMPSNSVLYNHFKKNQLLAELPELKKLDLRRWVQKELKSYGITSYDELLLESLIQSAESDPDKITEITDRLSLYIDGSKATSQDLSKICI